MRVFLSLLILILSLQSWTKADDIRDFEIEGISIGDSLLDYYSTDEINNNIDPNVNKNTDGKFKLAGFYRKFGEFDGMQFAFKANDKKFLIHSINGGIFYSNIDECKKKMKSISKEISQLFKDAKTNLDLKQLHPVDKSNESYAIADIYFLDTGSVSIRCTNWSEEITKKYNWSDNLRVGVKSKEYNEWLE